MPAAREPAVAEITRAVAAYGLAGSALAPGAVADHLWGPLIGRLRHERLLGPLAHAVGDGALPASPSQREEAATEHAAAMGVALVLERELLRVVGPLVAGGVDYRVLKGPAVAHLVYPDPSWRSYGDIDLLVPGDQFDLAVHLLAGLGYSRRSPELRPGYDGRFGKGATLVGSPGHEVDLHRAFVPGRYGLRMRPADLFVDPTTFVLAGVPVLTLSTTGLFMNACYHAALGGPTPILAAVRDVAQMLSSPALDVSAVREVTRSWDGEAVVAGAISFAVDALRVGGGGPLASWAASYRPRGRDRRAVRSYTTHRSFARQTASAITSVPGLRPKVAYLGAAAGARRRHDP